jgi:tight adherence protein C
MTGVLILMLAAAMLGLAAGIEVLGARGARPGGEAGHRRGITVLGGRATDGPSRRTGVLALVARLGLEDRIARSGMGERLSVPALVAAKLAGALAGLLTGLVVSPAAPGRLALVVALGMPVAGFLAPDAWLERRARARLRSLRGALPDALDLLSVGAAAGRSPLAGMAEIGCGEGPLARELAVLAAETACGAPQREALEGLRARAPVSEVAGMCGVIERSHRYGSPLAEQLQEQASAMRSVQRTRVEEHAARAAPKIQLAVALLLVPSVLLMIAAGLLANVDRFLAGL